jgi:hypothetical protein
VKPHVPDAAAAGRTHAAVGTDFASLDAYFADIARGPTVPRAFRRFEVLLPQKFNDGQPVPVSYFEDAIDELRKRFGGVSAETQDIEGYSVHRGQPYEDELVRLYVDVPDSEENVNFFRDWKERLREKFRQAEIWIATHAIEVL